MWKSRFFHDAPKTLIFDALIRGKAGFHDATENKVYIWCIITLRSRFSRDAPKTLYLMHYYVEKQVFLWRTKKVQYCCITIRFSHDTPKTLIFNALIRGKAGFIITRPKTIHTFDALAGFLVTHQKHSYLMHYYMEKQVFSWRTKNSYIRCINTWKSRFSHGATENKVYIWCIITFRIRFSHGATKTLIFDALLRGKEGILMTRLKNPWLFDA